ncbi:MAG: guanylate kinase [Lachnospiraceae bacterium]|nr:guanylate kinase [Lachnospiraceae bacterium]
MIMIYYLMGKSASGKDSIYKMLLLKNKKLQEIAIYTTRPKRDNEVEGIEYHFVDEKYLIDNENKVIEKRVYHTVYGDWYYATLDDGNIKENENYLMIGTLESYVRLKKYFGENKVYPIYIEVDDKERKNRAIAREMKQKVPKLEEMERRFIEDAKDFSEENIKSAGIIKRYQNEDLEDCVSEILKDIKQ